MTWCHYRSSLIIYLGHVKLLKLAFLLYGPLAPFVSVIPATLAIIYGDYCQHRALATFVLFLCCTTLSAINCFKESSGPPLDLRSLYQVPGIDDCLLELLG